MRVAHIRRRWLGRSPYGERGLKFAATRVLRVIIGRSPYGERGLKFSQLRKEGLLPAVALLTESVD